MGIFLISLEKGVECYLVCPKMAEANFVLYFSVIFFSSQIQVVYLSLIVLVWFLFELILFESKNLSLFQNTILAMLITNYNSVYFGPLHLFGLI